MKFSVSLQLEAILAFSILSLTLAAPSPIPTGKRLLLILLSNHVNIPFRYIEVDFPQHE